MIGKKIFELPDVVSPVQDTDILAIVQGVGDSPETRKIDVGTLKASVSGTGPILDITHAEMKLAMGSNNLIKGALYKITDFQTIHQIPNTSSINAGITEPLVCLAISNNNIDGFVFSQLHPEDIIEYDVNDVVCEDGVTARKGKIIYRKDNFNNLETYYDFRNVKFRRWALDGTGMTAWAPATSYTTLGQLIYEPSSLAIYALKKVHTSGSTFNNYDGVNNNVLWIKLVSVNEDNYHAWNVSMDEFSLSVDVITANGAAFQDKLTFASGCKNILIAPSVDVPYNNIVFVTVANNCTFGTNTYNATFDEGNINNILVAQNCNGIIISEDSNNIIIRNNCTGIVVQSLSSANIINEFCSHISLTGSCIQNEIGSNSSNNYLDGGGACLLEGSNKNNIIINGSFLIKFSPGASNNEITALSGSVFLGVNTSYNRIVAASNVSLEIGSSNNLVKGMNSRIGAYSQGNTIKNSEGSSIGANCNNNTIEPFTVIDGSDVVYSETSVNNIIHEGCSDNIIFGSNNTLMQNCSSIVCEADSGINGCYFASGVKNKTFTNTTKIGETVQNLSIQVRTDLEQTFDIDNFLYNDLVFNSRDTDGNVWAPKVDSYGVITMVKLI